VKFAQQILDAVLTAVLLIAVVERLFPQKPSVLVGHAVVVLNTMLRQQRRSLAEAKLEARLTY
jgi:hypothetical protein